MGHKTVPCSFTVHAMVSHNYLKFHHIVNKEIYPNKVWSNKRTRMSSWGYRNMPPKIDGLKYKAWNGFHIWKDG